MKTKPDPLVWDFDHRNTLWAAKGERWTWQISVMRSGMFSVHASEPAFLRDRPPKFWTLGGAQSFCEQYRQTPEGER